MAEGGNGYLVSVTCGIAFAALCVGALIALMCRHKISEQVVAASLGMSISTDALRHEEEKSNNLLQEHFNENMTEEEGFELLARVILQTLDSAQPDINKIVIGKIKTDPIDKESVKIEFLDSSKKQEIIEIVNRKYKE